MLTSSLQDPKATWMTKAPFFLHPIPYPHILPSPKVLCKLRAVCSLQLEHILFWLQGSCVTRFVGDNHILILQVSHEYSQSFPQYKQILLGACMYEASESSIQPSELSAAHKPSQLTTTCKLPGARGGCKTTVLSVLSF